MYLLPLLPCISKLIFVRRLRTVVLWAARASIGSRWFALAFADAFAYQWASSALGQMNPLAVIFMFIFIVKIKHEFNNISLLPAPTSSSLGFCPLCALCYRPFSFIVVNNFWSNNGNGETAKSKNGRRVYRYSATQCLPGMLIPINSRWILMKTKRKTIQKHARRTSNAVQCECTNMF